MAQEIGAPAGVPGVDIPDRRGRTGLDRAGRDLDRNPRVVVTDVRLLTSGPSDEGPAWAASSREILFQRTEGGRTALYRVTIAGNPPRKVLVPQDGLDPDWSGVRE